MTPDLLSLSPRAKSTCSGFSMRSARDSMMSSCRICLSTLENPARLSCGHRFCESCLDEYWRTREKPVYIVCPLCRGNAFNVYFSQESNDHTDFHKLFSPLTTSINEVTSTVETRLNHTLMCLKLGFMAPLVYYLVKYLKPVLVDGYCFFQHSLGYGYKL